MKLKLFLLFVIAVSVISSGCSAGKSEDSYSSNPESTGGSQNTYSESSQDSSTQNQTSDSVASDSDSINEDDAKEIALADAGFSESEVKNIRVKFNRDDGKNEYEVDFYVGSDEYEYEISADDGSILSKGRDINNDFGSAAASDASITISEAKKIVLSKVSGATENDIHIYAEKDDGRVVYEGSVMLDDMEYEFEIDGETGKIISWEAESIFDD